MTDGKKRLAELAAKARANVAPTGDSPDNARAYAMLDELERELRGALAMPGLIVKRDKERLTLTRPPRNADIVLTWDRMIGAFDFRVMRHGEPPKLKKLVFDQHAGHFRSMDDDRVEIYQVLTDGMAFALYPEAK